MTMSHYALPLTALRAFEAAARCCSYSRAAEELGLTHGAVSHHIKSLEALLGVVLFRRQGRAMVPTEHGQRLAVHAAEGLGHLSQGLDEVRARLSRSNTVTVSVLPAFAAHWLISRLGKFSQGHPDVDVSIKTSQLLADFTRDGIDLAVRYGPGHWPGLAADLLAREEIFPVCSPGIQEKHRLEGPRDLVAIPLLRDQRLPWSPWFRAAGLDKAAEPSRGAMYNDAGMLLQAAASGHGVALARSTLVADELETGRLVRLFAISVPADFAYYVVYPSGQKLRRPALVFRDWLVAQSDCSKREEPNDTR